MSSKIRIAVVDDHPLYRDGVVFALNREADIEVLAEGASAEDVVEIARTTSPEIMLIDLGMPGGGMNAIEKLTLEYSSVKILVLTVDDDEEQISTALSRGAHGYLLKGASSEELIETIRMVCAGERYVPAAYAARTLTNFARRSALTTETARPWPKFSPREEEILARLVQGMSNKLISEELAVSEKTVKHYVTVLLQKLDVRSRVEAAWLAKRHVANQTKQTDQLD